jgi:hypothetical protein
MLCLYKGKGTFMLSRCFQKDPEKTSKFLKRPKLNKILNSMRGQVPN